MELDLNGVSADSLVQMIKASYILDNWAGILLIADKLHTDINTFYTINQRERIADQQLSNFGLRRSIVYYFGYSMCLKGIAFEKLGCYNEARECITKYEELGWINNLDAAGRAEVDYYRELAQANRLVIELHEGNRNILPDYLVFLRKFKDEILPGVLFILDSAIKYGYNVDHVLEEFKEEIAAMGNSYTTSRHSRYYQEFIYLEARYYSSNGNTKAALKLILRHLEKSVKQKEDYGFRKSVALFEKLRAQATPHQLNKYRYVMDQLLS